jgi:hypothetical protein
MPEKKNSFTIAKFIQTATGYNIIIQSGYHPTKIKKIDYPDQ